MQNPRTSLDPEKEPISQSAPNVKYERFSTISRPTTSFRRSARRSIIKEEIELDKSFDILQLIVHRRRCLLKNLFFISTIKAATYLFRETIVNNWTDTSLTLVYYILSNLLLILVTPFFVPLILRIYTVRTSLRLSVIGMALAILSTYHPFPYIFVCQLFLSTLPESVLCVAVRIYMIRISKIWSRIDGIDHRTTILRIFALHNVLLKLGHVFISSIKLIQPEEHESASDSSDYHGNATCGLGYCGLTRHLIVNYVYDIKYKNLNQSFVLSTILIVVGAGLAIGITVILDRLGSLSKSEFGEEPTACKTIDVYLQLCRPRMSYLLGIGLYHPFLITMRQQYLEAYATCALAIKQDHMTVILVSLAGIHVIFSAEIFIDVLGMFGSLQLFLAIFTTIFVILTFWNEAAALNVIFIFLVYYMLQYWTSIYGLFVILLTYQLIGDQEIAAWAIHTTIFWIGLTLSQAFHYMCMNAKFHVMIIFGLLVLAMTDCLRRENEKNVCTTVMNSRIIEAFEKNNKAWIGDSTINLEKAIDIGGDILWIETYWRRNIKLISYPIEVQL